MTTAPPFVRTGRTAGEPEADLTPIVVSHRAIRQDLRQDALALIGGPGLIAGSPVGFWAASW